MLLIFGINFSSSLVTHRSSHLISQYVFSYIRNFLFYCLIIVPVDWENSNFHCVTVRVPQEPTQPLSLFQVNGLFSSTPKLIHSYGRHKIIQVDLNSMSNSLSENLGIILDWDKRKIVSFNTSKTQRCGLFLQCFQP